MRIFKNLQKLKLIPLIILLFLTLVIIFPVLKQGYWQSDDGGWMVIRFTSFHESLRDGHFPVRWTQRLNHEFGYPVMNFLYPLPFYIAEAFHLVGFGFVDSIKLVFLTSTLAAAAGMFLFSKKWGNLEGFIGSLLFVFAPYRLFLLFTRGSLGESVALGFVPFVFLFIDRLFDKTNWKNILILGILFAGLIMSHNVIALLFTPLIIIYLFSKRFKKNRKTIAKYSLPFLIGILLSAFFWLPALWDLQYTKAMGITISEYASYYLQPKELIKMTGIPALFFILLSLIRRKIFFPLSALASLFLMHSASQPIIEFFPLLEKIQFPWRFATVFIFTSAATAAMTINGLKLIKKYQIITLVLVLLFLISNLLPGLKEVKYVERDEGFYLTNDDTTTVKNEFTPKWVKENPKERPIKSFKIGATQNSFEIIDQERRTGWQYLQLRLNETAEITFNIHYFPGWKIYVDDQEAAFNPEQTNGLLQVKVDPGRNNLRTIKAVFEPTTVRRVSEIISLLTALTALFIVLLKTIGIQDKLKAIAMLFLILSFLSIGFFVLSNLSTYKNTFNPGEMERKYLRSQWIESDFKKVIPIGDSGLYSWAGWEYVHGKNPILINPEMPPLGKYIIGIGLLLTKRAGIIGFIFTALALVTHYFLAKQFLENKWLAVISTSLFSLEPVLRGLFNITMLDGLQITFFNLAILFFFKGLKDNKWLFVSSLMLGGAASTKFFASTAVLVIALLGFLIITKNWQKLTIFLFSLPLILAVHIASYFAYFQKGNNLREYLGVQKWIYNFYRQGNVGTVPIGSYWFLVLFNRWRIWFGQEWGVFSTIKSNLWRITWPANILITFLSIILFKKLKLPEGYGILIIWLFLYSIFLSFIIGWPHYMLLFLPYSYILLVELGYRLSPIINKTIKRWKK